MTKFELRVLYMELRMHQSLAARAAIKTAKIKRQFDDALIKFLGQPDDTEVMEVTDENQRKELMGRLTDVALNGIESMLMNASLEDDEEEEEPEGEPNSEMPSLEEIMRQLNNKNPPPIGAFDMSDIQITFIKPVKGEMHGFVVAARLKKDTKQLAGDLGCVVNNEFVRVELDNVTLESQEQLTKMIIANVPDAQS